MTSLRLVVQTIAFCLGFCRLLEVALTESADNLVRNGGFEELEGSFPVGVLVPVSSDEPGIVVPGWNVEEGAVEIVSSRLWQETSESSLYAIHLNSRAGPGAMETELPSQFTTKALYQLTFAFAGSPLGGPSVKSLEIGFGPTSCRPRQVSTIVAPGANPKHLDWKTVRMVFAIHGSGERVTMKIRSLTSGPYGPLIDNVKLVPFQGPYRHHPALHNRLKSSHEILDNSWMRRLFKRLRRKFHFWNHERPVHFQGYSSRKIHPPFQNGFQNRTISFSSYVIPDENWIQSLLESLRINIEIWVRERFLRPSDM